MKLEEEKGKEKGEGGSCHLTVLFGFLVGFALSTCIADDGAFAGVEGAVLRPAHCAVDSAEAAEAAEGVVHNYDSGDGGRWGG